LKTTASIADCPALQEFDRSREPKPLGMGTANSCNFNRHFQLLQGCLIDVGSIPRQTAVAIVIGRLQNNDMKCFPVFCLKLQKMPMSINTEGATLFLKNTSV